jgi:GlpG protein
MRQVGSLTSEAEAARFAAYLVTEGITAHSEADGQKWIIWAHDENQISQAKQAYGEFQKNPAGEIYQGVEHQAEEILAERARQSEESRKHVVDMRGRWKRGGVKRRRPLVLTMIAMSVAVFLLSNWGTNHLGDVGRTVLFVDFTRADGTDPLVHVLGGEIWRLVTPIFYHLDMMHLIFNMLMFHYLASPVEDRRGTWRFGMMVLLIAAVSNLIQYIVPLNLGGSLGVMGGMSGVIYGVFGYSWMKTLFEPELGIHVSQSTVTILLVWLVFCMTPLTEMLGFSVANWAHGIGLFVGIAIGYLPILAKR